jgi:hypothetical protein
MSKPQFGTTRVFTLMDGIRADTRVEERHFECILMSSNKIQKLTRKTRRNEDRDAYLFVFNATPVNPRPSELHTIEELSVEQRSNFKTLI